MVPLGMSIGRWAIQAALPVRLPVLPRSALCDALRVFGRVFDALRVEIPRRSLLRVLCVAISGAACSWGARARGNRPEESYAEEEVKTLALGRGVGSGKGRAAAVRGGDALGSVDGQVEERIAWRGQQRGQG